MATRKGNVGGGDDGRDDQEGEFQSSPEIGTAIIGGNTFAAKAVQYAVINGLAMFEGDIVLGTVEEVQRQSNAVKDAAAANDMVVQGVVITGDQFRWPNCEIPFEIDPNLPNQQRVTDAIAHWQANTNYRFIQRTNQADFVRFVPGDGCSSNVGKRGGQQNVTLGAGCNTGNAIHEIGHVVGLWHEQSREDRDQFVTINWANITPGFEHNFNQHINDGDDVGAYDYGSIMHYPRTAFTRNGQDTITPTQAGAQIGQRNGLSAGDIAAANSVCTRSGPSLKFSDDPFTLKFRDDPTLKFNDDPQTLKFRDDPTLKFSDDPQPTLKFRDDPTLKFSDDPQPTLKFRDDPTLKFSDDPQPTLKFRDDPTLKFSDDPSTLKFSDDPGTLKFSDDGIVPPGGTVINPQPGSPPNAPFVLSTPHHSMAWAQSFPEAYQQQIAQMEAELEQRHQALQEADQAYQQGQLTTQDLQLLDAQYQQYQALLREYEAAKQGQR